MADYRNRMILETRKDDSPAWFNLTSTHCDVYSQPDLQRCLDFLQKQKAGWDTHFRNRGESRRFQITMDGTVLT